MHNPTNPPPVTSPTRNALYGDGTRKSASEGRLTDSCLLHQREFTSSPPIPVKSESVDYYKMDTRKGETSFVNKTFSPEGEIEKKSQGGPIECERDKKKPCHKIT